MEKTVMDRMMKEFSEVEYRVTKLRDFITNEEQFNKLDALNKDLCIGQLKAMESYLAFLSIRIGLNSTPENITAPVEKLESGEDSVVND